MDEPGDPLQAWSAPPGAVVLGVVAAVGLGAWAVLSDDAPGRLLLGLAALALAGAAALGGLARPRLAARADGLELRGIRGARSWTWSRVDAVRIVRMRRLGLPATYVEVDARDADGLETLLVLGRLELGDDPVDVAAALQDHRARAGRTPGPVASAQVAGGEGLAGDGTQRDVADPDGEDEHHEGPDDDRRGDARA